MRDAERGPDREVGPGPLSALWRYRLASLAIVVAAAAAGAALGISDRAAPTATTSIGLANPRGLSLFLVGGNSGADLGRYAAAQVHFIEGDQLLGTVSRALGGVPTVSGLRSSLTVSASPTADVISVTAKAPSVHEAARRTGAVATAYQSLMQQQAGAALAREDVSISEQRTALLGQIAAAQGGTAIQRANGAAAQLQLEQLAQTVSQAQTDAALFGDGTAFVDGAVGHAKKSAAAAGIRDGALGALVGLIVAGAVTWLIASRRQEVDTADDAARMLGVPVLGEVAAVSRRRRAERLENPARPPLAAYQAVATALGSIARNGVFLVVGPIRGEGRTVTTMALATAFAADGSRVVVMDADLRTSRLTKLFGLEPGRPGLVELVRGAELVDVTHSVPGPAGGRLSVIGAGGPLVEPTGLLRSAALGEELRRLRSAYDVVLVDTPAVTAAADALALVRSATGAVAVVRRRVGAGALHELREAVEVNGLPLCGLVFTFAPDRDAGYRTGRAAGAEHIGTDRTPAAAAQEMREPYPAEPGETAPVDSVHPQQ